MRTLSESLKESLLKGMFDIDDIIDNESNALKLKAKYKASVVDIDDDTIIIAHQEYMAPYVSLTDILQYGDFKNIYAQGLIIDCNVPKFVKKIGGSSIISSKKCKMNDVDFVSIIPGQRTFEDTYYKFDNYGGEFNDVIFRGVANLWFTDQTVFKNCIIASSRNGGSSDIRIYFSCGPEEVKQKLSEFYGMDLMNKGKYHVNDVKNVLKKYGLNMDKIKGKGSITFWSRQNNIEDIGVAWTSRNNYLIVDI